MWGQTGDSDYGIVARLDLGSKTPMYIRFVTACVHKDTGVRAGVFTAAYQLAADKTVAAYDIEEVEAGLAWFRANLPIPDRFNRSTSKGFNERATKGIAWFKPSAREALARIRELIEVLQRNGIGVEMITTNRPGYVVYEDDFQIVAEPFRDTRV